MFIIDIERVLFGVVFYKEELCELVELTKQFLTNALGVMWCGVH